MDVPTSRGFGCRGLVLVLVALSVSACGDVLGTGSSKAPEVVSFSPGAGTTEVSVLEEVKIRFSSDLDPSTVAESVRLEGGSGEVRTRKLLKGLKEVILQPTDPLDFGTTYRVVVKSTLLSRVGNNPATDKSWEFSTEGRPFPSLEVDSLRHTLQLLAHDSMRGRGSGSQDELRAAYFLDDRFGAYGLHPPPGGSLQGFQAVSRRTDLGLTSQNVVATIPGAGPLSDEWIVVGAHYDHIGLREQADGTLGINNGADDNGSGTVLLLEIARIFQSHVQSQGIPPPSRRSVLFAAFGAEEEGLLGSCHMALESPVVPLGRTIAMMNFDMVGRLGEGLLQVGGLDTGGRWANILVNSSRPALFLDNPPLCQACSDFACFRDQGVPYLWFFTGLHDQYHTPLDDVERIDFQGLAAIGGLALRVLGRLAVMPEGPASG